MPEPTRIAALVVLTDHGGRVLLVRTAKRAHRWELPGGQVESGESPMDAARREIREETAFAIDDLTFVGLYYGNADNLLRIAFAATVESIAQPSVARPADPGTVLPTADRRGRGRAALPGSGPAQTKDATEILESAWFDPDDLPHPMPVVARRMISAALSGIPELAMIEDDSEVQ